MTDTVTVHVRADNGGAGAFVMFHSRARFTLPQARHLIITNSTRHVRAPPRLTIVDLRRRAVLRVGNGVRRGTKPRPVDQTE